MQSIVYLISTRSSVKQLISCLTMIALLVLTTSGVSYSETSSQTASQNIPSGYESYLIRPDILNVQSKEHSLDQNWQNMKAAHFSFVAELLTLYSADTHLYFLARDSELLYDVARLVTHGTPNENRIHLLNISRINMRDQNIKSYLFENDISEQSLQNGKKVLFIDTGFSGTIPRVIGELFPQDLRQKLKTHLIVSSNESHPSSRTFLMHLNPMVNEKSTSSMHGTIITYEHMPRYTDRSNRLLFINGKYHPLSRTEGSNDGQVSKGQSLKFMEDLQAHWNKKETQERFKIEMQHFAKLKHLLSQTGDEVKACSIKDSVQRKIWLDTELAKIQSPLVQSQKTASRDNHGIKFERRWKLQLPVLRCLDVLL